MPSPKFKDYINPVMDAIKVLGGSARPVEVYKHIANTLNLSDDILNEERESGGSRFENQVAWARFYLVKSGYIDSSRRGVWSFTDKGREVDQFSDVDINQLVKKVQSLTMPQEKDNSSVGLKPITEMTSLLEKDITDEKPPEELISYREELLKTIQSLSPSGFERLCQRLLREYGFQEVTVTGKSSDGGIDGVGVLQINPFVSFKVLFQSKRYAGSVGAPVVRDFRGAMAGRTDKGIIITTGTFTAEAKREADRDGASPIKLIDGDLLINLFEELELGLKPRITYDLDSNFFDDFKE